MQHLFDTTFGRHQSEIKRIEAFKVEYGWIIVVFYGICPICHRSFSVHTVCVFVEALIAWMATISFLFHTILGWESVTNGEEPRNCGPSAASDCARVSVYFIDRNERRIANNWNSNNRCVKVLLQWKYQNQLMKMTEWNVLRIITMAIGHHHHQMEILMDWLLSLNSIFFYWLYFFAINTAAVCSLQTWFNIRTNYFEWFFQLVSFLFIVKKRIVNA